MAKNKRQKVKHYNRSFYSRETRVKRGIGIVVLVAAVLAAAWFAAPHVLDWATHTWYTVVKDRDLEAESASRAEAAASSAAASSAAASQAASELEPEEEFYHIKRLRLVDDKPIFVQNSYVITEFILEEDAKDKDKFTSIYDKLRQYFGIDLYQADSKEITEIVFPAPEEESRLLELDGREPSAFIRRYTYLFDGRTIEYIEGYKRWDYFSIEIEPI